MDGMRSGARCFLWLVLLCGLWAAASAYAPAPVQAGAAMRVGVATLQAEQARPVEPQGARRFGLEQLALPFRAGAGQVITGYGGSGWHFGGDYYALDFVECAGGLGECAAGALGRQEVLAPADLTYVAPVQNRVYLFELAEQEGDRLCLSLGHFYLLAPGLRPGMRLPKGASLGLLSAWDPPHIHMGLYTVSAPQACDCTEPGCRRPLPFDSQPDEASDGLAAGLALDGQRFAPGPGASRTSFRGAGLVSNLPGWCAGAYDPSAGEVERREAWPKDPSGGCFPTKLDLSPPVAAGFHLALEGATIRLTAEDLEDQALPHGPGSGVREARFLARAGGDWVELGLLEGAPYELAVDACLLALGPGDVEFDLEVRDYAGNRWLWGEHYPAPRLSSAENCPSAGAQPEPDAPAEGDGDPPDLTPPEIEFVAPAQGARHDGGEVWLQVEARDEESGISAIQFFVRLTGPGGGEWQDAGWDRDGADGWGVRLDLGGLPPGRQVAFFAYAYDEAGNIAGDGVGGNWTSLESPVYLPLVVQ